MTAKASAFACIFAFLLVCTFWVGPAVALRPDSAGKARVRLCRGKARRLRPGRVSFWFTCQNEDITGFDVRANRSLHSVYDPDEAFFCERTKASAFSCEDIHAAAFSEGSGVVTVSEPLCRPGAHLVLRIVPTLNNEVRSRPAFRLRGPC